MFTKFLPPDGTIRFVEDYTIVRTPTISYVVVRCIDNCFLTRTIEEDMGIHSDATMICETDDDRFEYLLFLGNDNSFEFLVQQANIYKLAIERLFGAATC